MSLELCVRIALPCRVIDTAIEILAQKHVEANERSRNIDLVFRRDWHRRHSFQRELEERFHIIAFDFDLIRFDFCGGIIHAYSSGHIKLPAMPRTGHDIDFEFAFPERASAMETGIINDMKLPVDVEDRKGLSIHFRYNAMSGLHIRCACDSYKLSHTSASSVEHAVIDS